MKTIILPESKDDRVVSAAKLIIKNKIAKVILIQKDKQLEKSIRPDKNLTIIDVNFSEDFAEKYHEIREASKPDLSIEQSREEIKDPLVFSCMLLKNKFADGIIAGSVYSTSEVLRRGIQIIGLSKGNRTVSSFFLFEFPKTHKLKDKKLAFADCGVIPVPSAEQMSDIAIQTSHNFKKLTGRKPKVAFLSFSTKGSAKDGSVDKVINAFELTKKKAPGLVSDGELQFDAAFVPEVSARKNPGSKIKGDANVFIFPDLNSGNIAYKITERIGGAFATGPIVQGLAKPVMDLSRGCNANDIVNMAKVIIKM